MRQDIINFKLTIVPSWICIGGFGSRRAIEIAFELDEIISRLKVDGVGRVNIEVVRFYIDSEYDRYESYFPSFNIICGLGDKDKLFDLNVRLLGDVVSWRWKEKGGRHYLSKGRDDIKDYKSFGHLLAELIIRIISRRAEELNELVNSGLALKELWSQEV